MWSHRARHKLVLRCSSLVWLLGVCPRLRSWLQCKEFASLESMTPPALIHCLRGEKMHRCACRTGANHGHLLLAAANIRVGLVHEPRIVGGASANTFHSSLVAFRTRVATTDPMLPPSGITGICTNAFLPRLPTTFIWFALPCAVCNDWHNIGVIDPAHLHHASG